MSPSADDALGRALVEVFSAANVVPPPPIALLVAKVCEVVGARSGRVLVADYGLRSLRELGPDGPVGPSIAIEGTVVGRVFADGEMLASGSEPTTLRVPLIDG